MFTWKPLDVELLLQSAAKTGCIVTAENHNCTVGLGAAVARVLAEHCPIPVEMVGVQDRFGQVGAIGFLTGGIPAERPGDRQESGACSRQETAVKKESRCSPREQRTLFHYRLFLQVVGDPALVKHIEQQAHQHADDGGQRHAGQGDVAKRQRYARQAGDKMTEVSTMLRFFP